MRKLVFEVRLRDNSNLPMNIIKTEGRQKILELLAPFLDVYNVTFVREEKE